VLSNVEIFGPADDLMMGWFYHDYISENGTAESREGEYDLYDGKWEGGYGLYAGPDEDIRSFHTFYKLNGKQYAVGINFNKNGDSIYIALVRP